MARLGTIRALYRYLMLEPIELGYIAAAVPRRHRVVVLDLRFYRNPVGAFLRKIENLSPDIIGFTGYSGLSVYGATKASMLGFTKSLAREVGRLGVTVNAVAPGIINTAMSESAFDADAIARMVPMKRAGTADEVAELIGFLASTKAAYITGQIISINGGII